MGSRLQECISAGGEQMAMSSTSRAGAAAVPKKSKPRAGAGTVPKKPKPRAGAAAAPKKSSKKGKVRCTKLCKPGRRSICPNYRLGRKTTKKAGQEILACYEVERMLKEMGVTRLQDCSRCVLAGIQRGAIKITGKKEELDKIVFVGKGDLDCDHDVPVRFGEVLYQTDYGGDYYE